MFAVHRIPATVSLSLMLVLIASPTVAQHESHDADVARFSANLVNRSVQEITLMTANSTCAKYSWSSRGRAPAGYTKGVTLSYARGLCRAKQAPLGALAKILSAAESGNASRDALTHYRSTFSKLGIKIQSSGSEPLRALYVLGMGLGMRESSGQYCEGWDRSAGSNRSSAAAEAGLFQASYDSIGTNAELRNLYLDYQNHPDRCWLDVFKEGVQCSSQSILGSGAGATFQRFNKSCPAFATEYAMVLLRVLRNHFGPINRKEAEVVSSCNTLLMSVQKYVDSNPDQVCKDLM